MAINNTTPELKCKRNPGPMATPIQHAMVCCEAGPLAMVAIGSPSAIPGVGSQQGSPYGRLPNCGSKSLQRQMPKKYRQGRHAAPSPCVPRCGLCPSLCPGASRNPQWETGERWRLFLLANPQATALSHHRAHPPPPPPPRPQVLVPPTCPPRAEGLSIPLRESSFLGPCCL